MRTDSQNRPEGRRPSRGSQGVARAALHALCVASLLPFLSCSRPQGPEETVIDLLEVASRAGGVTGTGSLLEFDAQDHSLGRLASGWSGPERSVDDRTFTWVEGTSATIQLPATATPWDWLHFRCRPFVGDGTRPQRLDVRFNGVDLGAVELTPGFADYSLSLPPDVPRLADNRVELSLSYAARPSETVAGNGDRRELSAAFDRLTLAEIESSASALTPIDSAGAIEEDRLVQSPRTEWSLPVTVPGSAALEFRIASETAERPAAGELRVRVVARETAGGERVLHESTVGPHVSAPVTVDLSALAGRRVELVLQVFAGGAAGGGVQWLEPRIVGESLQHDGPSNIVLIVIDTLRADALACYGGQASTPNIDALAASGVRFEQAYAHAPMTGPSHSSMFTSLLPTEHGVEINTKVLHERHMTLAELLRDAGWRTAGFVSLGVLAAKFGVAQGFDEYHATFDLDWWKTAADVNRDLLPWIEKAGADPRFLFVHYSDPHEPYTPPGLEYPRLRAGLAGDSPHIVTVDAATVALSLTLQPGTNRFELKADGAAPEHPLTLRGVSVRGAEANVSCGAGCVEKTRANGRPEYRLQLPSVLELNLPGEVPVEVEFRLRAQEMAPLNEIRRLYRGEVEAVDAEVGRLMQALAEAGRLNDTLVVLTADHGEGLGDHDLLGHVHQLYETLVRVPLIVSWPDRVEAGRVVNRAVSHVDLAPTLLEYAGVFDPIERSGSSLAPLLEGLGRDGRAAPIVTETFRPEARANLVSIVHDGQKLIRNLDDGSEELYRLADDPDELRDRSASDPGVLAALVKLLEARMAEAESRSVVASDGELSEADIERLRALGYLQ